MFSTITKPPLAAIAVFALLLGACGIDPEYQTFEGGTAEQPAPSPYATGYAALEDGSRVDLVFAEREVGNSYMNGLDYAESLDGNVLSPGTRFETSRLVLPVDVPRGRELSLDEIGGVARLVMARSESVVDLSAHTGVPNEDPLCEGAQPSGDSGERFCGKRWFTTEYTPGSGEAEVFLRVDDLDLRPGGRVKVRIRVPNYRHAYPGAAAPLYCCAANASVVVDAALDADLRFASEADLGMAFGDGVACQYASLEEARNAVPCPGGF